MKTLRGDLKARAYSGILAEPMPKWGALTQPPENEVDELIDEKWKALFAHYGLDPTDAFELGPKKASAWANLAWHLARQHVPGFPHAPRKRGKPAERKSDDVTLFMHVELFKRRDRLSERKAIQIIANQNIVSGSEGALLQRYKRAKNLFRPMSEMFDRAASSIGTDGIVSSLEDALSGDKKETILSPDQAYD
ncbi:MAG: hypothetical protein WA417_03820 [Stellaceae bacterium]